MKHTFKTELRPGLLVEAIVDLDLINKPSHGAFKITWTGQRSINDLPAYLVWMKTVLETSASLSGKQISWATPGKPDEAYLLTAKPNQPCSLEHIIGGSVK